MLFRLFWCSQFLLLPGPADDLWADCFRMTCAVRDPEENMVQDTLTGQYTGNMHPPRVRRCPELPAVLIRLSYTQFTWLQALPSLILIHYKCHFCGSALQKWHLYCCICQQNRHLYSGRCMNGLSFRSAIWVIDRMTFRSGWRKRLRDGGTGIPLPSFPACHVAAKSCRLRKNAFQSP